MKYFKPYIIIIILLLLAGCNSEAKATDWHFGDALAARVKQIKPTVSLGVHMFSLLFFVFY